MVQLLRTNLVIETSERHLESVPTSNLDRAEIASYLARISAVVFYSEMEERLREVVRRRFIDGGDQKLAHFLSKTNDGLLRRMKRKEIVETVALFGEECREEFQGRFPEQELATYANVIRDRHETSHGEGADVTLSEVRAAVDVGERILTSISEIIA